MNPAQFLSHFDRISDAPDAIPRLRRFILDLAVRGKLVQQDSRDEPASELLKRIQTEKAQSIYERRARKSKDTLAQSYIPFNVPADWEWVPFGEIVRIRTGKLDANAAVIGGAYPFFTCSQTPSEIDSYSFDTSAVLLAGNGDFNLKCYQGKFDAYQRTYVIEPLGWDLHFCFILMKSQISRITENQRGSAIPYLKLGDIADAVVPLPALAEQRRIVAKVDELMALCDRLEATQMERERRRDRLVVSSLNRLNNGADANTFREHAHFYFNHLPRLTTKPEHIQQFRQAILNLAVRGKLVPQDPKDEPTSDLLSRMGVEKSQNGPFLIPISWAWVSVDQVGDSRLGKMLDKGKNKGTPRRYLRNVNVRWFDFDLSDVFEMPFEDDELEEFVLHKDDVLICEGGEPGRAAIWDEREKHIYFQKAIHRVRFSECVMPHFFVNALRESADSGRLSAYFTGVGIKHFTGKGLASYTFPLPPLTEQHRIVAKVDELMALCDKLEAQLTTTHTDSRRLLDAVLHEALAPAV